MMGSTHITLGALAGAALALATNQPPDVSMAMIAAAAVSSVVPDIDHPNGMLRQRLGLIGDLGLFWLKHRNITHTLLILSLLVALVIIGGRVPTLQPFYWYMWAGVAGYASHLIADAMTKDGIPLLWPLPGDFRLIGRLSIRSGGFIETVINALATWGLITIILNIFNLRI
jgi:inner membrane protein